ncbi:TonB-dependent receptor plug domain-containing protein [Gloeobacter kilaueensis]|uniref:TonB-dependent receptor n=1 Tax=Gloeobacter kilaueensis (strain ATCC BAA-2537 / CCAP 1431/1 / ULC 316 / JS1) TaxID=1183438 RepID=U5QG57_GLOK1|nr:TonB-dependent receptor [Gloeobacter kilaueensis]AGY56660.1 TonB-dependent receptor [Gloeobacter kilaueensis JS1]
MSSLPVCISRSLLAIGLPVAGIVLTALPGFALPTAQELRQADLQAKDLMAQDLTSPQAAPVPRSSSATTQLAASEPSYVLDTVTVTGTLRQQKVREIPGSVYVIDQKEIEQKGARTVGDALRGVPGVVSNMFGQGADVHSTYFIRGLPTTSTALLIDGRSINNLNQEHVDLNELPVAQIDRIEVLTGGATTLYGSTAVGGAINVITKRPPKVFEGSAEVTFGSYGYSDYRVRVGGPISDNLRFDVYATTFKTASDYYYQVDRPGFTISGIRKSGAVDSSTYGFDLDWDIDPDSTLSFNSYYRQGGRGITLFALEDTRQAIPFFNPNHPELGVRTASANTLGLNEELVPRIFIDYYGAAATFNHKLGADKKSNLQVRVAYDRGRTTEFAFGEGDATDISVFSARLLHDWQISPGYNLSYGFDFIQEGGNSVTAGEGQVSLNYEATIGRPSFFALNTFKPADNVTLTAGLRASFGNSAFSRNFNRDFQGSIDPSIGVRWQVTPEFGLRGTFTKVYKTPNFNDLFGVGEIKGNPGLEPEKGSTWDVGFDWQPSRTSLIRMSYFINDIQNLLGYELIESGNAADAQLQALYGYAVNDRVRVNFPEVRTSGFELSASWQFVPRWTVFATETYTDARIGQGFKDVYNNTQYPLVPFHSGQAGVSYDNPSGWRAALFVNFQGYRSVDPLHIGPGFAVDPDVEGEEFVVNPSTGRFIQNIGALPPGTLLPGYATLNLSFQVPLTRNLTLTGYIDNLTSARYERNYGNGAPPINFTAGLRSSF